MFAPTKSFRKWTRKVNVKIRKYAVRAALSASSIPALVMARGHNILEVPEVPLVVPDSVESLTKTKDAMKLLKEVGLGADILKVERSRGIRAGKGKRRTRRYNIRKAPVLIVSKGCTAKKAFRNILGFDVLNVRYLNLLKLTPGGHVGRMLIWTESAFKQLDKIFSRAPDPIVDSRRVLNSEEVQGVIRKKRVQGKKVRKNLPRPRLNPARKINAKAAAIEHRTSQFKNKTQKRVASKAKKAAKAVWLAKVTGKKDRKGNDVAAPQKLTWKERKEKAKNTKTLLAAKAK